MALVINDNLSISESLLVWSASRASGSGGQHVNKTSSKVELRFDFQQCVKLSVGARERLAEIAGSRLDADGRIRIESQATRSQFANREDVRERLADMIRQCLRPPKKRRPTKPTKGSKRRRIEGKRKQSDKKNARKSPQRD